MQTALDMLVFWDIGLLEAEPKGCVWVLGHGGLAESVRAVMLASLPRRASVSCQCITSRLTEVILLLYSVLLRHIWRFVFSAGLHSTRHGHTRVSLAKEYKDESGTGASVLWGNAETVGSVQPGETKAHGDLSVCLKRGVKATKTGFSQWYPVSGWETMDTNEHRYST